MRVLVVEDSFDDSEIIERLLISQGFEVVVVLDKPQEAIRLANLQLKSGDFDIIVCDGLDGLGWDYIEDAVEAGFPALVLSASTPEDYWIARCGQRHYVDKIRAVEDLEPRINGLLN